MFVAGGAPPVDAARRLARQEAAILPEILARPGPLAAVQSVDDGGGDAARLEDQARHGLRERAGFAARALRRLDLVLIRALLCRCHPTHPMRVLSLPMTPSMVSPSARAAKVSAMRCLRIGSDMARTWSSGGDSRPSMRARARAAALSGGQ